MNMSSCCTDPISGNISEYTAAKAVNRQISNSIQFEDQKSIGGNTEVDIDVMTVYPHSNRSQKNRSYRFRRQITNLDDIGRFSFTITSDDKPPAVIDKFGWTIKDSESWIQRLRSCFDVMWWTDWRNWLLLLNRL